MVESCGEGKENMKAKWLGTGKAGKIRLIILLLIGLWCAYSVICYSYEIYNLQIIDKMVKTDDIGPVIVGWTDFSLLFKAALTGANVLMLLTVYGVTTLVIVVLCVIPLVLFWLIGIRKAQNVTLEEAELARNICGVCGAIGLFGGIVITGFRSRMPAVWFSLCWLLPAFLIVVVQLRKRIPSDTPTGGEE